MTDFSIPIPAPEAQASMGEVLVQLYDNRPILKWLTIFVAWSLLWVICSDFVLHYFLGAAPPFVWNLEWLEGLIYVVITGTLTLLLVRELRRESLRASLSSESKLRTIQAAGLIGIYTWRQDSITDANDSFLRMLGYDENDLKTGRLKISELVAPEYQRIENQLLDELSQQGKSGIYQQELIAKAGNRVSVVGGRALIEGRDRGIGYALDITALVNAQSEQRQLEAQLQSAHRLVALGQLTGGIAHDFNNLLGVIVGYAAMGDLAVSMDREQRQEVTTQVLSAAEKARGLIRKLLSFSQKQADGAELLDVNAALSDLQKMLSRVIGDTIELRLALGQDVGCVLADRTQLEQIVMNLVVNARDAMPRGGVITVETGKTHIDSQSSAALDLSSGNYVRITVHDTGIGMAPDVSKHVFEPFFSTKKESGGTGLGLAIVHGIVTQLKGHIDVESRPGQGAQFRVLLPWAAGQANQAGISDGHIQGGDETILIIEDAEELCAMMAFVLRGFGYTVLSASDGQQGVEVARKHPGKIELLLTDIAMPRLGGPEAAEQIRRERPDIKVLMMTGFAGHELQAGKTIKNAIVLEKPVTPAALARAVRDALDQAG